MIQSLGTLNQQVSELNKLLSKGAFIQKIQSTPTTFCIRLRAPGQNIFIHIGRGRGVEGVWLNDTPPKKDHRIKDRFDDWLKKNLIGLKLLESKSDDAQRLLVFKLSSKEKVGHFGIFYKGRNLYFSFLDKDSFFQSWIGKKELGFLKNNIEPRDLFEKIYDGPSSSSQSEKIHDLEEHYESLLRKKANKRKKNLIERKIKKIEDTLGSIDKIPTIQENIYRFSNQEVEKALLEVSLRIKVKRNENDYQFRDRAFKKMKSFKASRVFQEKKLSELISNLDNVEERKCLKKVHQPIWAEIKGRKLKNKNVLTFTLENSSGAVGKNIKGNDYLRTKYGKPLDLWFHVKDEKSCHVVFKSSIDKLTPKMLELIGSMIRDIMKKSSDEINLVFTSLENIRGLKGKSGAVSVLKPNYSKVLYNPEWKEIISFD